MGFEHRIEIIERRTRYELEQAEAQAHIWEGLMIALDNIDEVIKIIRGSKDEEEARQGLMKKFGLSLVQSNAILAMRLRRLTGLQREELEHNYAELMKQIDKKIDEKEPKWRKMVENPE